MLRGTTYAYDGLNRMTRSDLAVGANPAVTETYALDNSGNRTDAGYSAPTVMHEYLSAPGEAVRHHDLNGNWTGDGANRVVGYDSDNQMVFWTDGALAKVFTYDSSNRRVAIDENNDGANDHYFLFFGDRILEEYDGAGNLANSYVYGNYVDEIIQREDANGDVYYFHTDDQWNTVALTDASGSVVERYLYDDFGVPTVLNGLGAVITTGIINDILFQGRDYDFETKLYNYRARYYDPEIGRFTSRDPLGIWGDVLHLGNGYSYLNHNPWSLRDPFGSKAGSNRVDFANYRNFQNLELSFWQKGGRRLEVSWEIVKAFYTGGLQGAAVIFDTPGQLVEWAGIGERPLKFLGAYKDSDPGITGSRISAGVAWTAIAGIATLEALGPSAETTVKESLDDATEPDSAPEKKVPNPNGSRGSKEHQDKIDERIKELEEDGHKHVGGGSKPEERIDTPEGEKNWRQPDITTIDPDGETYYEQIGRTNRDGTPVSRERRAMDDIEYETGIRPVFTPYDR